MSVVCDNCGSNKNVRRAFITLWNGGIMDLCKTCYMPLARLIDEMTYNREGTLDRK